MVHGLAWKTIVDLGVHLAMAPRFSGSTTGGGLGFGASVVTEPARYAALGQRLRAAREAAYVPSDG
jgi:hypothetical protein